MYDLWQILGINHFLLSLSEVKWEEIERGIKSASDANLKKNPGHIYV